MLNRDYGESVVLGLQDKALDHLLLQGKCVDKVLAYQSSRKHSHDVLRFLLCVHAFADEVFVSEIEDTE